MTNIKICGLSRPCDIEWANALRPEYIGFVFFEKSPRNVAAEQAKRLKALLNPKIKVVGVFVNADPSFVAGLLSDGVIDIAQLHGKEDENYIAALRLLTDKPIVKAFRVDTVEDVRRAEKSTADYILLDSGDGGTGTSFDWSLLSGMERPFFLAGGLYPDNVREAIEKTHPFAVDVSSGVETDGYKDKEKMRDFVLAVRGKETCV